MHTQKPVNKWLLSLLLVLVAALSTAPFVDQRAVTDYEKLFQRAFITFAMNCRRRLLSGSPSECLARPGPSGELLWPVSLLAQGDLFI